MINILLLIVRSTVICVGLLLLYIALFLHEDEEQQLQTALRNCGCELMMLNPGRCRNVLYS